MRILKFPSRLSNAANLNIEIEGEGHSQQTVEKWSARVLDARRVVADLLRSQFGYLICEFDEPFLSHLFAFAWKIDFDSVGGVDGSQCKYRCKGLEMVWISHESGKHVFVGGRCRSYDALQHLKIGAGHPAFR